MKRQHNIVLLLAGGAGRRMHASTPKQFMEIDNETVLLHSMLAFERHPLIHEIYVVCKPEWEHVVRDEVERGGVQKFADTITAGDSSFASARNGIMYLRDRMSDDTVVMVHDAVRPLVSQDIISRNIAVCLTHGNAVTALAGHEAYLVAANDAVATDVLPREGLLRAQTPVTFPLAALNRMMSLAAERGIAESQSLVTLAGELGIAPLYVAQGELRNFKLTEQADILIYRALKTLEG